MGFRGFALGVANNGGNPVFGPVVIWLLIVLKPVPVGVLKALDRGKLVVNSTTFYSLASSTALCRLLGCLDTTSLFTSAFKQLVKQSIRASSDMPSVLFARAINYRKYSSTLLVRVNLNSFALGCSKGEGPYSISEFPNL